MAARPVASKGTGFVLTSTQTPKTQTQKIFRIRRDYNSWVANESMEDYALRYTPRSFRKWSEFRVANTAFGAAVAELVQTSGRARAALLLGPELTPHRRNAGSSGRPAAGDAGQ